ncbi:MAG: hypothetical protein JSV86_21890 [Gemmatimonadota bacterium]|nr:MAG: hypothetical protein JSV86_21890 [Gemmatimonadota bacterium]
MTIANFRDGTGWRSECADCGTPGLKGGYPGDIVADLEDMGWQIEGEDDGVTYADAFCPDCQD